MTRGRVFNSRPLHFLVISEGSLNQAGVKVGRSPLLGGR